VKDVISLNTVKTLAERIRDFEFHPEVYSYPTPRMYRALDGFSPADAEFTEEINVYVHIPFCRRICSFCGYMKTIDRQDLRSDYVEALVKEIALYKDMLRCRRVRTLHIGGGTPSLLSSRELETIFMALTKANPGLLDTSEEVSIEATPESVEKAKFEEYRKCGINRVSLGIQSFNGREIELANRCNLSGVSVKAIETLRETGIENIVIDLMIGIEGQTLHGFQNSIREALVVKPDTVQLYALGLMPQTGLGRNPPPGLMTDEHIYRCHQIGRQAFMEAGYRHDRHNLYTVIEGGSFLQEEYAWRGMSLLGLGAGARSYAYNIHYRNTYDSSHSPVAVEEYIQNIRDGAYSVQSGIILNDDEKARRHVMGNIESLDRAEFHGRFGVCLEQQFGSVIEDLRESGLVVEEGSLLRLTPRGLLFRELVVKEFFSSEAKKAEEAYRPKRGK